MMKIVVIDDHALLRELLVTACKGAVPGSVVDGANDATSGLNLCREKTPDLIILDLALPDRDGLELLNDLLAACPRAKIIGLSGHTDDFTLHQVSQSKLHGFVDKKEQTIEQLAQAIQAVMGGERYFSPAAMKVLYSQRNDPVAFNKILSKREQELLHYFGRGLGNVEIAGMVNLSEFTVRNHRCRIMAKLGVRTTAELIRYALEKGFVRVDMLERGDTPPPTPPRRA